MAINNQIIGGNFTDLSGAPLANGYLIFELSQDEQSPTPGQIGAGRKIQVNLDNTGNVPSNPASYVFANDSLSPTNSFYYVSAYTASGQLVWGPQQQQVLSAPSPFNLSAWVPNAISSSSIGGSAQWGSIIGTLSNQTDLQTALNAKAPLASPALTGTPTAPTANAGTNTTQIATTAFVETAVAGVNIAALNAPAVMWVSAHDLNSTPIFDNIFTAGSVNLGNQISSQSLVLPNGDVLLTLGTGGTAAGTWYGYTNGTASATQSGVKWGTVKLCTMRAYAIPGTPAGASKSLFVFGLAQDSTSNTLKPSVLNTTAQANWGNTIPHAAFVLDSGVNNRWQCQCGDGSAITRVDSGVVANTSATDLLQFSFNGSVVTFYINGVQVATINTTLPPSSTGMCLNWAMTAYTADLSTANKVGLGYGYVHAL